MKDTSVRNIGSTGHAYTPLAPAHLEFDGSGTPVSSLYQDVYHARQGAIEQARRIFLHGNGLPERWRGREALTVCETGFGLGRNFLTLWQAWRDDPLRSRRLHVLAFEAHPFHASDLHTASQRLPIEFQRLSAQLIAAWPALLPGVHRLEFEDGRVTLTLYFGGIERTAREAQAGVDAFFLDGFAPDRNPEMWSPSLFGQLVRMARPGATAATWCVNGAVRRALRDAGFIVTKAAGFGGKREITHASLRPGLGWGLTPQPAQHVAVIGAGPAGAAIAHALSLRGRSACVIDPALAQGAGAGHRGHLAAAITPMISRDDDQRARLSRAGVFRALHRWQALIDTARPRRLGTIELQPDAEHEAMRQATLEVLKFPTEWVRWMDADEVSRGVGFAVQRPGTYFADGQLVQPEPLLAALLDHSLIELRTAQALRLEQLAQGWRVHLDTGQAVDAAAVVVANSINAAELLRGSMDITALPKLRDGWRLAGQVSHFRAAAASYNPSTILSAEGYWLPAVQGINVAGGTYLAHAPQTRVTSDGHRTLCGFVADMLGRSPQTVAGWLDDSGGWAGWRAVVAGRLPVFGPVRQAPGLWLACAYGSRGFTWASLAGDVLAATLEGEPVPLERSLLGAVAPR